MHTPHILVFYGSHRPTGQAEKVASWLKTKLEGKTEATFEYVNVAGLNLPFTNVPGTMTPGMKFEPKSVEQWVNMVEKADGYIVIANEYNHGVSSVIKNAIDYPSYHWHKKAVGFISYGGLAGGVRAVEHLRQIFSEVHVASARDQIMIPTIWSDFDAGGKLMDEKVLGNIDTFLSGLLWWVNTLKAGREEKVQKVN